ncbi:MAG: hypothetical protein ABIH92_00255 [Nanoarchaeota archaeon]
MEHTEETKYGTHKYTKWKSKFRPNMAGSILNWGAKLAGAAAVATLGHFTGEAIEYFPSVSEHISNAAGYLSGADFSGNLSRLGATLGAVYGLSKYGFRANESRELKHRMYSARFPSIEITDFVAMDPGTLDFLKQRSESRGESLERAADGIGRILNWRHDRKLRKELQKMGESFGDTIDWEGINRKMGIGEGERTSE